MARVQLSREVQQELLSEFCQALLSLKTPEEAVKFLTDLLTKSEALMLAKRIKIAKLLLEDKNYRQIEGLLKVGHTTIAKIATWLTEGGEGFRLIAERTKKERQKPESSWDLAMKDWKAFKRKYPLVFWPELVIEDIIKSANKKQKEKLRRAIEKLDHKSKIYKQINAVFRKNL